MSYTTLQFDSAAKLLLGQEIHRRLTDGGFNRADLCREIAQRSFIDDLAEEPSDARNSALEVIRFASRNLWKGDGCLGLISVPDFPVFNIIDGATIFGASNTGKSLLPWFFLPVTPPKESATLNPAENFSSPRDAVDFISHATGVSLTDEQKSVAEQVFSALPAGATFKDFSDALDANVAKSLGISLAQIEPLTPLLRAMEAFLQPGIFETVFAKPKHD